jgi:hypothetical protein
VYCYRSGKDSRQYQARTQTLSLKLSKDSSEEGRTLHSFASDVQRHLELNGKDAFFYVLESSQTICIIVQQHLLFTVKDVADLVSRFKTRLYDGFDADNLIDSLDLLLNSIESIIKLLNSPFISFLSSGPEIWM